MSNYTKTTNFGAKDTLPSGDSQKILRGSEFDTEFNNIATSVATKLELDGSSNLAVPGTFSATKIIPTGGTSAGNGLYLPSANTLALSTNGVERVRVDSSGNVTLASGTANGVAYLNGSKVITAGNSLVFNGTNLGVGTSSPGAKLHVSGGGEAARFEGTTPYISLFDSGVRTSYWFSGASFINFVAEAGKFLQFLTIGTEEFRFSPNQVERMRLTSSGNLGIGTGAPTANLHVVGTANISSSVTLSGGTANGVAYLNGSKVITTGSSLVFDGTRLTIENTRIETGPGFSGLNALNSTPLIFYTDTVERMRLTPTGGVGIGCTPASQLHVNAGGSSEVGRFEGTLPSITLYDSGVRTSYWFSGASFINIAAENGKFLQFLTAGEQEFRFSPNQVERLRLKATGQLRFVPLSSDPTGAQAGDVYYNSTSNKLKVHNGTSWVDLH